MTNATHDCIGCPVSAGTHKPADAVHTEIAEPGASGQQTEATKVSRMLRGMGANSFITKQLDRAADLIDAQDAELSTLRARCADGESEIQRLERELEAREPVYQWTGTEADDAMVMLNRMDDSIESERIAALEKIIPRLGARVATLQSQLQDASAAATAIQLRNALRHIKELEAKAQGSIDEETLRLAKVALFESEGQPMVCDWMSAAIKVCRSVASSTPSPAVPVPAELLERVIDALASFAGNLPHKPAFLQAWEELNDLLSLRAAPAAPAPSDEAIIAWTMEQQADAIKALRASGFVRVARAVLARWAAGVPAAAPDALKGGA